MNTLKVIIQKLKSKLVINSIIYVSSDILNKAVPFLLLPLLTMYLSPSDYGILASFNSLFSFINIFTGLSVFGAIGVNYFKLSKIELSTYIGNVFMISIGGTIVITLIVFLFLSHIKNITNLETVWIYAAILMSSTFNFILINQVLWMYEGKSLFYGLYQNSETILKVALSLFFILGMMMNWQGRVLAMLIGNVLSFIISIILIWKRGYLKLQLNKKYILDALNFGLPLIPHQLSFWLKNGAVIFLLTYLIDSNDIGLFDIGKKIALVIMILATAFNKAWSPFLFKKLSNNPSKDTRKKIVKISYMIFLLLITIATIISFFSSSIIQIIVDEKFYSAHIYIKYFAFSSAFDGMYLIVVNYIFFMKKNIYLAYITFSTSIIQVLIAYVLIKANNAIGAAQASLIVSILTFIIVWGYSNKFFKMPWNIFK